MKIDARKTLRQHLENGNEPSNNPLAEKLIELQRACQDAKIEVSWDGWISEASAAILIGISPKTLANRRYADEPLKSRRILGRIQYSLVELARLFIVAERNSAKESPGTTRKSPGLPCDK